LSRSVEVDAYMATLQHSMSAQVEQYILVFRGHRIHMRSFRPIAMPEDVVVIETRAL
jgi:hypothetical protein